MLKNKKLLKHNKKLYRSIHKKYVKSTIQRVSSAISFEDIKIKKLEKKIAADIGCGALGLGAINLVNLGFRNIYLFDLNKKNTLQAKKNINKHFKNKIKINILIQDGNLEKDVLPKKKFDLVLCQGVLHHVENDKKSLKNIYNSMKSNGVLILSVQGKGGIVTDFTHNVLSQSYHNDKNTKLFFDKIFKNSSYLTKYVNFLKKNSNADGQLFLNLFLKMADKDFMQTLEDRIKSLKYHQYTIEEIKQKLNSTGFKKIYKIKKISKFRYNNIRQIFNSLYLNKNKFISKIFYGKDSSHINLRVIK